MRSNSPTGPFIGIATCLGAGGGIRGVIVCDCGTDGWLRRTTGSLDVVFDHPTSGSFLGAIGGGATFVEFGGVGVAFNARIPGAVLENIFCAGPPSLMVFLGSSFFRAGA